jgi:hypothetical protein
MFSFQFCNGSFNVGEFQNHLTVCMRRHGGAQQQQRSEDQVSVTTQPYFRYIGHSIKFVAREKGRTGAFCNNFVRMCTKLNFHPKWINVMCFLQLGETGGSSTANSVEPVIDLAQAKEMYERDEFNW